MSLSTHVLDTDSGRPVAGLGVQVLRREGDGFVEVAAAVTDDDGRVRELLDADTWGAGRWQVRFDVAGLRGAEAFFPTVTLEVAVTDAGHYHAALLLGRFAYTTYRGS